MSAFDTLVVSERAGGTAAVRFAVRVQPRSSRPGVDGMLGNAVRIRVSAPPVDGAANEAVVDVLAKALGVARSAVAIVGGAASRSKVVEVSGLTAAGVRDRLTR